MVVHLIVKGKLYRLPASQLVVLADNGLPVAAAYETAGTIVQSDAADQDFARIIADLGFKAGVVDRVE